MDVLQLGARLELHELVDRRSCRDRAVQDSFDLPRDRHGHPEALREGGDGRSAADTFGDRQPTCESLDDSADSAASPFALPGLAYHAPTTRAADGSRGFCVVHHALTGAPPEDAFEFTVRPADAAGKLELTALELRLWRHAGSALRRLRVEPLGTIDLGECTATWWEALSVRPSSPVVVEGPVTVRLAPETKATAEFRLDAVRLRGHVR